MHFKWGDHERETFKEIKEVVIDVPSLSTPNFSDQFILYTFSFELSYAAILTQPNE